MDAPTGRLFVPVGASPFVTYEGLPSDEYLWLLGQGTKMLREELPFTLTRPARPQGQI